jgi:voltage-gated potassium channel
MDSLRFRLRIFMVVFLGILVLGILGFGVVEGLSPLDALYFTLVTVTTVGYGDIHPATPIGKLLAILLIIGGVGTFLGVVANATEILLSRRENQIRTQKLHMVTGLFFAEVGNRLLSYMSALDAKLDQLRNHLMVTQAWTDADFSQANRELQSFRYEAEIRTDILEALRQFLEEKSTLLLRLLENPILLEKGSFTELLRAVFHLREELLHRDDLSQLPKSDYAHLAGDIKRVYPLLLSEWLEYMKYLKENYPYLFSLATRTNPFSEDRSAIVK